VSNSRTKLGYAVGAGVVGVMSFLISLQDPHNGFVTSPILAAVLVAAYIGGVRSGLFTTALATVSIGIVTPLRGETLGQMAAVVALGIAVSLVMGALHRAYADAQRGAERFAQLFNVAPLPTALVRMRDRTFVEVNQMYLELFAVTVKQVIGKTAPEAGIIADSAGREALFAGAATAGRVEQELVVRGADGRAHTLILSGEVTELDGEQLLMVSCKDVTAWRRAESDADAADKQLHELAEMIDASFWVVDAATGDVLYVSPGYERIWGRTRQEYMENSQGWITAVHPDDRIRVAEALGRGDKRMEFRIVKPDGSVSWLSDRMVEIRDEAGNLLRLAGISEDITARKEAEAKAFASDELFRSFATAIDEVIWMIDAASHAVLYVSPGYEKVFGQPADETLTSMEVWADAIHDDDRERALQGLGDVKAVHNDRFRIVRPDGSVRWIDMKAFPVRDERGKVTRIAGISRDVTEILRVEQGLQQAQKLESVGLLAGGIAHDFNNILCVITGNAETLGEELADDHAGRAMIDEIQLATDRASSLTRQLLAFSRKQIVKPVVIELNRAVDDARRMLRRILGENIELRVALDPDAGSICIDPAQLTQVLMNLCVNARDAIGTSGTITVETRTERDTALLVVSDSGHGMTEEVKRHVFEPFFTTKEVGRGTGLGLAVVHGIVEQAGGTIELESELGKGTTFRIRIPVVGRTPAAKVTGRIQVEGGREWLLVVDDDEHVRGAAARALKRLGYNVVEACDGVEALKLIKNPAQPIDMIVTDVVMPNMGGRELAEHAAIERPYVPVLYVSGYTDDEVMQRGVEEREVRFLHKPFRTQVLAQRVREILDGRSTTAQIPVLRARRPSSLAS
jgi:PAS domain S-box-containing protein